MFNHLRRAAAKTSLFRPIRSLLRDERGIGVVGIALTLPGLMGLAGLGVEVGLWYKQRHDLQVAADAGAVAAAYELARSNEGGIVAAATAQAVKNGFTAAQGTISVVPNTSGGAGSVAVNLTREVPRLLSSLFLGDSVNIAVAATASVKVTGDACVLALDQTLDKALDIQGSTILDMPSCTLASNSASPSQSAVVSGSATLAAASLWAHGGMDIGGSAQVTLPDGRLDRMWRLADPYADLTIPSIGSCTFNNKSYSNVTATIDPGVFCGGLTFGAHAVVTLRPGVYYVLDGDLSVGAQATLRCNCTGMQGVTFVLTTKTNVAKIGQVKINGGSDVQLVAPSDPTSHFSGILIYQDRRATSTQANKLNGGSTMTLTGAVYAPAQAAEWTGNNGSATASCTRLIARTITFIGNSRFNNTGCAAMGVKPIEVTSIRVSA